MSKLSYFQFCNQLRGYKFYNDKGTQIYNYELYFSGISPADVFKKFKPVIREKKKSIH